MKKFKFIIDGHAYEVAVNEIEDTTAKVTVNGTDFEVEFERQEEKKKPAFRPAQAAAPVAAPKPKANGTTVVKSPLPGSIVKVLVAVGQEVKKGDVLLTMESMKMENNICAESDGVVKTLFVEPGKNVMQDDKLLELETATAAAAAAAPQPAQPVAQSAPQPAQPVAPAGGMKVKSPLPGSVVKVLVTVGQEVKKGDVLLTLESMKMENNIMAERDGKVAQIAVEAGHNVMQDDLLMVLE